MKALLFGACWLLFIAITLTIIEQVRDVFYPGIISSTFFVGAVILFAIYFALREVLNSINKT